MKTRKPRTKIKVKPLCNRLRGVVRTADRAVQEGQDPELAKHAAAIRTLGKRVVTDIIEIGRRLIEARRLVVHGNATAADGGWAGWLQTEFQWSDGTATNFMRVYELAEDFKTKNFTDLTFADLTIAPSAMYVLARPSTPDEVRDEIIERAAAGEAVTHSTVQEAIAKRVAAVVKKALAQAPTADETETPAPPAANESPPPDADEADTPSDADEADTPSDADDEQEAGGVAAAEAATTDPVEEELRRWWRDLVMRAGRAMEDGEVVNSRLDLKRQQILQAVVEPTLLPTLRKGGEGLIKLADFLGRLASREDEEANGGGTRT
jgi:hypothetical protein